MGNPFCLPATTNSAKHSRYVSNYFPVESTSANQRQNVLDSLLYCQIQVSMPDCLVEIHRYYRLNPTSAAIILQNAIPVVKLKKHVGFSILIDHNDIRCHHPIYKVCIDQSKLMNLFNFMGNVLHIKPFDIGQYSMYRLMMLKSMFYTNDLIQIR